MENWKNFIAYERMFKFMNRQLEISVRLVQRWTKDGLSLYEAKAAKELLVSHQTIVNVEVDDTANKIFQTLALLEKRIRFEKYEDSDVVVPLRREENSTVLNESEIQVG